MILRARRGALLAGSLLLWAATAFAFLHDIERPALDEAALAPLAPLRAPVAHPVPLQDNDDDLSADLHTHLFMKPGMGFFFHGGFFGPLRARDWKSRFSSQANPESVERSRIGLLVVALYAHPLLTWSPRAAIREEIRQAGLFVAQHPDWVIARSPAQARQALAAGKRVMVLSLEGASGILESEADLREFIDEKGVRIVTLLHITDDHYGGVAFLRSYHALSTPWRWFVELFKPRFASDGTKVNDRGLTSLGQEMARKLAARGVWLDLSHASDASQKDLAAIALDAGQPLLYTHTSLRKYLRAERGLSEEQLAQVRASNGLVGLCPSEDMLNPTESSSALCGGPGCPASCDWGLPGFVTQYAEIAGALGPANALVGSDFNGALPHLHPSCGTGTELDREGLWNIGQMGALWDAARRLGAPVPARLHDQIGAFLDKWTRVAR